MNDKEYTLLSHSELFRFTDEPVLRRLLEREGVKECAYQARQSICSPKHFDRSIGVLLSGSAAVEKHADNASMLMSVLQPGDVFGAATILSDAEVYPVSIRTLTPSKTLIIPEETFLAAMREDFPLTEAYMRYLTGRIRFLNSRIDGLAQPSAEDRLYNFLCNNAVDGVCVLGFPIKSLADALCIGRATLYRAFDTLEEQGRIRRSGRSVKLLKGENEQ